MYIKFKEVFDLSRLKRDLQRITINVPVHVLSLIDEYANKNGLSRTTAITILCVESLNNQTYTLDEFENEVLGD